MMSRIMHPLLALLASDTRQDLARQVAYLKEENRVLREPRRASSSLAWEIVAAVGADAIGGRDQSPATRTLLDDRFPRAAVGFVRYDQLVDRTSDQADLSAFVSG